MLTKEKIKKNYFQLTLGFFRLNQLAERVDVKCLSDSGIPNVNSLEEPMCDKWADAYGLTSPEISSVNPENFEFLEKRVNELKTWERVFLF